MDFQGIEALLGLPEFRVIAQVFGPQQLDLHLQRRDDHLVCPRCQAYCSHVKESRPRCLRDLPILEHPVILWLHMRRFQCAEALVGFQGLILAWASGRLNPFIKSLAP